MKKPSHHSGPARGHSTHAGQKYLPLTADGESIDQIEFRGNIIPHPWCDHLKTNAGKTDGTGCILLSEIVYWYRGSDVTEDGKVVGRKRKFHGDLLQLSYDAFGDRFGFTKNQVRAAMARLEANGVIKRVFRTIVVRGTPVSNVLFIQILPDKIREISFFRDETPPSREKSREGGSQKKNKEGAEQNQRGVENPPERGGEFSGDKYREDPKEDPEEFREMHSTSSEKPDKPAPLDSFSLKTECGIKAEDNTPEPEDTNHEPGDESKEVWNEDCNPDQDEPVVDETDFDSIRMALESAFGGQTFTAHGKKRLKEYTTRGRITRTWVDALAQAKSVFDADRKDWNKKHVFIPVQPPYLFSHYDLTAKGILEILGERHQSLQCHLDSFDEDSCQEKYETDKRMLDGYDREFRKNNCLDPGYPEWIAEYPGRRNHVVDVLCDHNYYSGSYPDDVVPPAWMRVHYAWKNKVYEWELIRSTLLTKAQEEIRQNPRMLKPERGDLTHEVIKELFGLDYPSELQRFEGLYNRIDIELARLEKRIGAVEECQCAAESCD